MGTPSEVEGAENPFRAGQVVDGRYRILRRLSAGGVGVVYEAEHSFTGLRVALKALHNRAGDHPERMQAEARTLAEMRHANIVQITDGGVTDGVVWFTMELLKGASLRQLLARGEPIELSRALKFGIEIASGVAAAHDQEVIHRDLKPENVFILEDDSVKVLDFGTSKITNKFRRSGALKTTDRFRLIGTQAYMPPERLKAERTDGRADIYALGHILYEMITGRHCWSDGPGPLDFPDAIELGTRQIFAPPTPPSECVHGLPTSIDRLVLRALAKDPRHRQQSMRELRAELDAALRDAASSLPARLAPSERASSEAPPLAGEEDLETTTEEVVLPFGHPPPKPSSGRSVRVIDADLLCGAARFAASSTMRSAVEVGLAAIAEADANAGRTLALVSARADERSRSPLRAAVARIGSAPADARAGSIERFSAQLAKIASARSGGPPPADVAFGAAQLLEPADRTDAAESALFRLEAAEADVQSFALSVLIALGRTPIEMHPAPRGALLALLLGGADDSELARSELAAFVLNAASLEDAGVAVVPQRPAAAGTNPQSTRVENPTLEHDASHQPARSWRAAPDVSPGAPLPAATGAGRATVTGRSPRAASQVRMGWVLLIGVASSGLVVTANYVRRAASSAASASAVKEDRATATSGAAAGAPTEAGVSAERASVDPPEAPGRAGPEVGGPTRPLASLEPPSATSGQVPGPGATPLPSPVRPAPARPGSPRGPQKLPGSGL